MTIEIKTVTGSGTTNEDTIVNEIQPPSGEIWYVDTITVSKDPWNDFDADSGITLNIGIIPQVATITTGVNEPGDVGNSKGGGTIDINDANSTDSHKVDAYLDSTEKIALTDSSIDQNVGYDYVIHIRRVK